MVQVKLHIEQRLKRKKERMRAARFKKLEAITRLATQFLNNLMELYQ
jgi:hypothetical protein